MIPKKDGTSYNCPDKFRECMGHKRDHDESTILNRKTVHSDTPDSSGTTTTTQQTVAPEPTPTPTPAPSSDITYACGVHSGPSSAASSDHSTVISGYSGSFYECQPHTNGSCGHTYLMSNASTHALQASCSETNSNGDNCTVTSFYACQTHTHVYPPPPITYACGIHSGDPSNSSEHVQVTGGCGHTYYKCQFLNGQHYRSRCSSRSRNGGRLIRCTVRYWRCLYPNGDGHTHTYGR